MTHRKQIVIQPPVIYDGLGAYELAGWHQYNRKEKQIDLCEVIEKVVDKLPVSEKILIKRLQYYQPVKTR